MDEWTPEQRAKDAMLLREQGKWLERHGSFPDDSENGRRMQELASLLPTLMPVSVVREYQIAADGFRNFGGANQLVEFLAAESALSQWMKE